MEEIVVGKKEKKRLLIYAHYYAPDVASTGQLIQDMAEGMIDEYDITVICTVPSYTQLFVDDVITSALLLCVIVSVPGVVVIA